VIVDERKRAAVAVWTGPQVAWQMARGIPGAFGRKVNAPYVWISLMLAFALPFLDPRRPFRWLHLDVLALLAFSLSHLYFNRGEIFTSVPLVYPVLGYLLLRMLLLGYGRKRAEDPPRLLIPPSYLALALVFLVGFRVGLNLTSSNVIDVGYSGVIGADKLAHCHALYGHFPADNPSGDTYGPFNYLAYLPFELLFPWSGKWDSLPAAHAAAIFFDLATLAALLVAGRRLRPGQAGRDLGVVLAYAWASYPYTLFVLSSNANDSLVALLVVLPFLALGSSRLRGATLALAGLTKFAPLALVPLLAGVSSRRRTAIRFAVAFASVTLVVMLPVLFGGGISDFWDRTVGFQLGRDSPFSVWGQEDLGPMQDVAKAFAVLLAVLVGFTARRKPVAQLAALGAAVLIAVQLALTHWFYLYVVWFFPLVLLALLGERAPAVESEPTSGGQQHRLDRLGQPAVG
jgi:Glycosyltransferase family 87